MTMRSVLLYNPLESSPDFLRLILVKSEGLRWHFNTVLCSPWERKYDNNVASNGEGEGETTMAVVSRRLLARE
jgi:hypothetical protein